MNYRPKQNGPIRALFVLSHTGRGGAETALKNLVCHLDPERVSAKVFSLEQGDGSLVAELENFGIPVIRVASGRLRQIGKTVGAIRRLVQAIRGDRTEVVVSNGGHPHLYARPAAHWTGTPTAFWVHDHCIADPLVSGALGLAGSVVRSDLYVANSQGTARAIADTCDGVPVEIIPPGIDPQLFGLSPSQREKTRQAMGIGDGEWLVGMFARLQEWKGQHIFLEAAAELRRMGIPARFWIVGGETPWVDGDYPGRLRRLTRSLGLSEHVEFLGSRADVAPLMMATDAVVHASIKPEPWGLVVAEAMALARPVVATAHGGPLEMIRHGDTGMLIPPGDARVLAAVLSNLWRSAGWGQAMGERARRHAQENFCATRTADRWTTAIENLSARGRPR